MNRFIFIRTSILLCAMAFVIHSFGQSRLDTAKGNNIIKLLKSNQYKQAFSILDEIQEQYTVEQPGTDYAKLLVDISDVFDEKGNYQSGLEYAFAAYNIASVQPGLERVEADALFEIARIYYFLNQPSIGLDYAFKELAIARELADDKSIGRAFNSIGTLQDKLNNDETALRYYDSALVFRKKVNDSRGLSATLYYIGLVYEKKGEFEKAISFQLKSKAIDDSVKNMYGVAWSYQKLGELSIQLKDHKHAERYLNQADSLAKIINSNGILVEVYRNKKELLKQQGNDKQALFYAELFIKLKDSIYTHELLGNASALQSTYELNLKNLELKEQRATLKQQRNFIVAAGIVVVLVGLLAFFYYRSFSKVKKLNKEIANQNDEIKMQSEELTEANSNLLELNRAIEEQKEEIQAQAEELTESNQTIYQINQHLEETVKVRTNELMQAYKELDTFFYRASHDFRRPLTTFMGLAEVAKITVKDDYTLSLFDKVRQTANNLDKMLMKLQSISDVGLQHLGVKEIFIKDIFDSVFTTFYESLREEEMKLSAEVLLTTAFYSYPALLKVVLENLVENSIHFKRPGGQGYIYLQAYEQENEIVLEVRDNGQGIEEQYHDKIFDMYFRGSERSKGNGLGLYIVKKAVEKLKGRIIFQSTFDSGSVFSVFLPKDLV